MRQHDANLYDYKKTACPIERQNSKIYSRIIEKRRGYKKKDDGCKWEMHVNRLVIIIIYGTIMRKNAEKHRHNGKEYDFLYRSRSNVLLIRIERLLAS